ncbi:tripartite tricarboxylate transporter substrate binding protein [Tepidanaerobacter sp. GT38]|uniref:tripartite tricarboxylate transporter substrate binding protein n=1 Tax=Tepidanaerobacter sp. GT38 TaxID=2722793 RepID=UPI001F22C78C|nr:tripartite tricarboxylate transporter substrate binding protein [Tepidanaerobacter sp. GT38]MCG1013107.1 tripartite tricarboxylate transporter substrate binding protein [Tepidanaerobacter sp. GT38]
MKKTWAFIIIGVLIMTLLVGCGAKEEAANNAANNTGNSEEINWPDKAFEVVLHAAAGGDTDFNARTFAQYFEEITGQPMVVTNMDGAGGTIATQTVLNSPADGTKALFTHIGPLIVNEVSGLIDYNFEAFDIATIPAVDTSTILVASKSSGIKSYEDLVEKAKAEPEKIIYGTELGGFSHLQGLLLQERAGIKLQIVDAGSASEKVAHLLGDRIDLAAISYGTVKDHINTGDMVAIAQFGAERNPLLGDIPTFKEKGVDLVIDKPYVIAFPKGTDPAIIKRMSDIAVEVSQIPEYGEKLEKGFYQTVQVYETEEAIEYLRSIREDFMKYKTVLRVGSI